MTQKNLKEKVFDLVHLLYQHSYDQFRIPIMNKITEDRLDFSKIQPLNIQNLSIKNNNTRKLVLGFSNDDKIARLIRRIEPPLIIVYGDMLPEMRGRFVHFCYKDSFQPKIPCCVQGVLFKFSPIVERT